MCVYFIHYFALYLLLHNYIFLNQKFFTRGLLELLHSFSEVILAALYLLM